VESIFSTLFLWIMAKKAVRLVVTLACTECGERNYTTEKNRRNDPNRLEFNRYCPRCRIHRLHRETK
jgi:large subunit ribosomal protein L33